jgi:hypothetical protein
MKHLKETKEIMRKDEGIEVMVPDFVDQAILAVLEDQSFLSLLVLAKRTCTSPFMIHRRVKNSMRFVAKHLHWVSHRLSHAQFVVNIQVALFSFTWTIRGITMARRSRPRLNTGDLPELRTHLILRISVLAISGSLV